MPSTDAFSEASESAFADAVSARVRERDDLKEVLRLAEELQSTIERRQIRVSMSHMVSIFAIGAATAGLLAIDLPTGLRYGLGLYAGVFVAMNEIVFVPRLRSRMRRDHRALREIVELVREADAHRSSTPLERAEFRIRLSRFEI